jgi:S-(hydroxymethyl)glutathione dehydrogenase / alcohol dehydrogenase
MTAMKAAVLFESPGRLSIEEANIARPKPHEVVVRVLATGLCHSDLHHLRQPTYMALPLVLGHEAAGIVEEVGSEVTYVKKGDHVVTSCRGFCGHCEWCLSGRPTLCEQVGLRRTADEPARVTLTDGTACSQLGGLGTFAEQTLVHENALVKIAPDIPLESAALLGCGVVTGVGAVIRTAKVQPGADVAVVGCGGVGLNSIQGAVIAGANHVIAIDIDDDKLEIAKQFGATHGINSKKSDVKEELDRILPGKGGVDHSFEALGLRETCELSFAILRRGGTATVIGVLYSDIQIPAIKLLDECKIQGSMLGSVDVRRDTAYFLDLYRAGRLKLDELISNRFTLEQINEGFDALARGGVTRSMILIGQ